MGTSYCLCFGLCNKLLNIQKFLSDLPLDLFELDGYSLGYAGLLHGDTIKHVGNAHGDLVVGDNEELGVFGEFFQDMGKSVDVALVQGGVHLIEDAERTGL